MSNLKFYIFVEEKFKLKKINKKMLVKKKVVHQSVIIYDIFAKN